MENNPETRAKEKLDLEQWLSISPGLQKSDEENPHLAEFQQFLQQQSKKVESVKNARDYDLLQFCKELQKLLVKDSKPTVPSIAVGKVYEDFVATRETFQIRDEMAISLSEKEVPKEEVKRVIQNVFHLLDEKYQQFANLKFEPEEPEILKDSETSSSYEPSLLEGEHLICKPMELIVYLDYVQRKKVPGTLFLSNFQMIFAHFDALIEQWIEWFRVPFACVNNMEKLSSPNDALLVLRCKDSRLVRLDLKQDPGMRPKLEKMINQMAFPGLALTDLFAFQYKPTNLFSERDGWLIYNIYEETLRMQIPLNRWRISDINFDYSKSHSYPCKLIIPSTITDEELEPVFAFRSKGRIPALTWIHPINRAVITRSSQPLVGIRSARCEADEKLLDQIREMSTGETLYILDARPKANAMTNQVIRGMGYENETYYLGTKLEFLNIPNIHVMRDSLNKVYQLCQSTSDDERWLSKLDSSHWLDHIRSLLLGSMRIVNLIESSNSVLLHCSDGWDRTAQLSALAQLLLDGHYRSIIGFEVLIEKEWLSFGHKFHRRIGHGNKNFEDDQRAPIFPQFIDCVYQLLIQFPCSFEFNEKFLVEILDNLYNCKFGTFLFNNERKRQIVRQRTVSLWTYINSNVIQYKNPFYIPDLSVLNPGTGIQDLVFWKNYYCRWHRPPKDHTMVPELRVEVLTNALDAANQRIKVLEKEVLELQAQLKNS